jgi:hypothetical protein
MLDEKTARGCKNVYSVVDQISELESFLRVVFYGHLFHVFEVFGCVIVVRQGRKQSFG